MFLHPSDRRWSERPRVSASLGYVDIKTAVRRLLAYYDPNLASTGHGWFGDRATQQSGWCNRTFSSRLRKAKERRVEYLGSLVVDEITKEDAERHLLA